MGGGGGVLLHEGSSSAFGNGVGGGESMFQGTLFLLFINV